MPGGMADQRHGDDQSEATGDESGRGEKHDQGAPAGNGGLSDVSGAGDTVIAVAALLYAATKDVDLMAQVANIAGGLVCEEVGTAIINKQRLMEECKLLLY